MGAVPMGSGTHFPPQAYSSTFRSPLSDSAAGTVSRSNVLAPP